MAWTQVYDPLNNWMLSTLVAALPIVVLLGLLAGFRVKPHLCAIAGGATAAPARGRASMRGSEAAKHTAMPTVSRAKK